MRSALVYALFLTLFAGLFIRFGVAEERFPLGDGMRRPTIRLPDLIPTIGGSRCIFAAVSFRNSLMVM